MLLNMLFGLLAACGISLVFNTGEYEVFLSNNFVNFIIFLAYIWFYGGLKQLSKRQFCCGLVFCVIISCCIVLGAELEVNSEISWRILTLVKIVCLIFSIYPLVNVALLWIDAKKKNVWKLSKKNRCNKIINKKDWYERLAKCKFFVFSRKHKLLMVFFVVFSFGFLVFLATYPGVYGYDVGSQLSSVFSDELVIRDHFSVPFVVLLGGIIKLGYGIFGNYSAGYAMFVLLQLVFISFVVARLSVFILEEFYSKKLFYGTIIFFCIFPLYTITVVSVVQDIYFAGFVVLLFIELYLLGKNPNEYWKKRIKYLIFGGLVLAVCFARNNGMYMLLVALPIIAISMGKGKRLLTCAMVVLPIVVYLIVKGPVYGVLQIEKGNTVMEMSSVPSQQLARVFVNHKEEFNNEQINEFKKYYNTDNFDSFYNLNPSISDLMKAGINTESVKKDLMGYIGLWVRYGLRYPKDYANAFAMNTYVLWYPNKIYPDTRIYHPLIEYQNLELDGRIEYLGIERISQFPLYDKILSAVTGNASQIDSEVGVWEFIPVISTFFTLGFYFVIVVACVLLAFLYKKWCYFVPLAIAIGLYCTLLLSPVGLLRYCLPIVILAPFLVGMCIRSSNKS